ncbi:hypothetical protein Tco_1534539, partial [Tanacetum coccineum]
MITDKYCPRNEIKKPEIKIWDLKVKGTDLISYTQHFQELALLCERMFPEESDKIEKYVGGLPDMIHESVVASKPETMQDAVEIATELIDKKICTFAKRQVESKRKFKDTSRNTENQQQQQQEVEHWPGLHCKICATELAIWPMTVGVAPMPTLLTTIRELGRVRSLLAMSVEFRDILRGNVQSRRTRTTV